MAWRQFVGKNTPEPTEMDLQAPGSTPLFDIQLKVVTGGDGKSCISIVPGLAAIEHALLRVVDGVVTAVKVMAELFHSSQCATIPLQMRLHSSRKSIIISQNYLT